VTHFRGCDTPCIKDVLRRRRFDALVVNGWVVKSCLQGLAACRKLKLPCLVRGEATVLRRRAWWKSLLHRRLLQRYAATLYIGEANRAFYEHHGVPASMLFPSLYCIENSRFQQTAREWNGRTAELRRRFGVPDDVVCYVFAAKFVDKKHPLELLQSFARCVADGARAHLLLVGDGELHAACREYATAHALPVTFTGFLNQSQIAEAYLAGDCLVLPSDAGETWGLVVNEAMACGRPAIVSSLVGCRADLIVPGESGDAFSYGDWESLARMLGSYAGDRSRLQIMGLRAQERVADYSPEAAARGIVEAARSVARPRSAAGLPVSTSVR
jgi:glycosyltransferase involved in cell wall biosynthesis